MDKLVEILVTAVAVAVGMILAQFIFDKTKLGDAWEGE